MADTIRSNPKFHRSVVLCAVLLGALTTACTQSINTCDDLEGVITGTTTEITGIESASIFKQLPETGVFESVDQINGTEFSNFGIEIETSWIEEQTRFRAPATIIQSFVDWLIPPAMACSLLPREDNYQPAVTSISIYSDSDFNAQLVAGSELSGVFAATGLMGDRESLLEAANDNSLVSDRAYTLRAAWSGDVLIAIPATPASHIFTITIALDNGSAFTIRTPEVLLFGV